MCQYAVVDRDNTGSAYDRASAGWGGYTDTMNQVGVPLELTRCGMRIL